MAPSNQPKAWSEKPAYVQHVVTKEIFPYTPYLEARGDMKPYAGELPGKKAVEAPKRVQALKVVDDDTDTGEGDGPDHATLAKNEELSREERVSHAVQAIPSDQYGKPSAGRPPLPKVGDVRAACGIVDVSVEEVLAVVESLNQ